MINIIKLLNAEIKPGDRLIKPVLNANKSCILPVDTVVTEDNLHKIQNLPETEITIERKTKISQQEIDEMAKELLTRLKKQFKFYTGEIDKKELMKIFLRHLIIKAKS